MTICRKRTGHRAMDGHDPKCATFRTLRGGDVFLDFPTGRRTPYGEVRQEAARQGRVPVHHIRTLRCGRDPGARLPQQGCAADVVQGPAQVEVPPQTQLRGHPFGRVHQHARRLHGPVPGQENQDGVRARASWTGAGCWALWHDRW